MISSSLLTSDKLTLDQLSRDLSIRFLRMSPLVRPLYAFPWSILTPFFARSTARTHRTPDRSVSNNLDRLSFSATGLSQMPVINAESRTRRRSGSLDRPDEYSALNIGKSRRRTRVRLSGTDRR